jgi:Zn-dependent peptidase ImmA (M78 family)
MPLVRVSAARIHSVLANRRINAADAAARIRRPVDVGAIVEHDSEVDLDDLIAIAALVKQPWPYLLIDDPEPPPPTDQDHRTVANRRSGLSAALIPELEAAERTLEASAELFPEARTKLPTVTITVEMDVEAAGRMVRDALGVSVERQRAPRDQYGSLRLWVAALHDQHVYVSQRRLDDPTVRAFSLRRHGRCITVVDTGDPPYARIFSLVHEYVHVLMHATGVCDLDDHAMVERFCNAVAAAALLPATTVQAERAWAWGNDPDEDDAHLKDLSRLEGVSQAVLLIRLRDRGILSQPMFDALDGRRQHRRSESGPGGSYYPTQINRVGRLFAGEVLSSFDAGRISRQDAAALLGVGEPNVSRFRTELSSGAPG